MLHSIRNYTSVVSGEQEVFCPAQALQLGHVLFTVAKCCSATELRAAPCYWHFPCHLCPGEDSTIMAILVFTMRTYNKITSPSVVKQASLPSPYLCFYRNLSPPFMPHDDKERWWPGVGKGRCWWLLCICRPSLRENVTDLHTLVFFSSTFSPLLFCLPLPRIQQHGS